MNYSFFKRPLAKIVQLFLDAGGSCLESEANLSGSVDDSTRQFIDYLEQSRNVILHGLVSSLELAEKLQTMDAFLICYDVQKD